MPDLIRHPVFFWIPASAGMTTFRYLIAWLIIVKGLDSLSLRGFPDNTVSWLSTSLKLFPFWIPDRDRFAPLSGMTRFKGYSEKKYTRFWGVLFFCFSRWDRGGKRKSFDVLILCVPAPLREIIFPSGFAVGAKFAIQAYPFFLSHTKRNGLGILFPCNLTVTDNQIRLTQTRKTYSPVKFLLAYIFDT